MLKQFVSALAGGVMIAIGGTVFLNAYLTTQVSYVGAFFFAVALVCISMKGYGLFTDRIGYLPDNRTKDELLGAAVTLLGNFVATFLIGALLYYCFPKSIGLIAGSMMDAKLETAWYATLVRAVLCGILMYLGASIYREKNSVLGVVFCAPSFILAGFEHSIADMFYYAAAGFVGGFRGFALLLLIVVGNAIGAMLLPVMAWAGKKAPRGDEETEPEFEVEVVTEGDGE